MCYPRPGVLKKPSTGAGANLAAARDDLNTQPMIEGGTPTMRDGIRVVMGSHDTNIFESIPFVFGFDVACINLIYIKRSVIWS